MSRTQGSESTGGKRFNLSHLRCEALENLIGSRKGRKAFLEEHPLTRKGLSVRIGSQMENILLAMLKAEKDPASQIGQVMAKNAEAYGGPGSERWIC